MKEYSKHSASGVGPNGGHHRRPGSRVPGRVFSRVALVLLLVLIPVTVRPAEFGLVRVADLNMRSGPGIAFPILVRLDKDAMVTVESRENGWLKVIYNGATGYILNRESLIEVLSESEMAARKAKELDRKAEDIQKRLKASEAELAETARREREMVGELNTAEENLSLARRKVRETESILADLNSQLGRIEQDYTALEKEIRAKQSYAAQRMTALYKLNWVGRIHLLVTADSFFDVIVRQRALERILGQDQALLEKLQNEQTSLTTLLEQLNGRKAEKRSLEISLNQEITRLNAEQGRRSALLEAVRNRKSLARLAMQDLEKASRELEATLQQLQITPAPRVTAPDNAPPASPFDAHKGLLNWPVRGKIVTSFGPSRDEKYDVTTFQSGINIQAERGEPIRAVSDGYAIFSGWFKGFGNMLIVDHGDHYYTVYAHLEEVFKVKGDRVEKEEVIATLGDSGSLIGPALHFEVRHHGKPVDPLQWIKKG